MAQKLEFTSLIINIKVNNKTIVTKKKRPNKEQTRWKKETVQSEIQIEKSLRNIII